MLQARQSELLALRDLPLKNRLTPLLSVPEISWNWEEDEPDRSLSEYLGAFPNRFQKALAQQRFFLDLPDLLDIDERISGEHPISVLHLGCRNASLCAVPVAGPDKDTAYLAAVRAVAATDGYGACLRLSGDTISDATTITTGLLDALGLTAPDVDVVVDLGAITEPLVPVLSVALRTILSAPPFTSTQWRSITCASGAFPASMSGLERGVHAVPCADWALWSAVSNGMPQGVRVPTFGDYGIQGPDWTPVDPRIMSASANIRYTSLNDWIVVRGRIVLGRNRVGMEEYRNLCQTLITHPEFRGADFSPGDRYISDCAAGSVSPGTPGIWRRQGTSHHLATVVDQVSN